MKLFNPPAGLGGIEVDESQDGIVIKQGAVIAVNDKIGAILLENYPYLRRIDVPEYGPDYHTLTVKKPWYKRIWHIIT